MIGKGRGTAAEWKVGGLLALNLEGAEKSKPWAWRISVEDMSHNVNTSIKDVVFLAEELGKVSILF